MSFSDPRVFYGIHSFTPYSRSTGLPYGEIRVLEEASLSMTGALVDLVGGSSKFPWASEDAEISAEVQLKGSQYEDFMFELFLGTAPTANAGEALGSVGTFANTYGATLKHATTGVATATVKAGSELDLKFMKIVLKATSTTAVDVYVKSNADINRGTDGTVQNDLIKVTATPLTIVASTAVTIPNFGIELTGGSGTIGMTIGNTAEFTSRPENSKSMDVRIGSSSGTIFPEFGAITMAQKRGNQELMEIDMFRCKAAGMPVGFTRNAWSKYDIKIKVLYDSVKDGLFDMRHVTPIDT